MLPFPLKNMKNIRRKGEGGERGNLN